LKFGDKCCFSSPLAPLPWLCDETPVVLDEVDDELLLGFPIALDVNGFFTAG
jgi:hypothetical protein